MISRDAKSLISNIEIKDERVAKSLILHLMKSLISDAKSLISKMKINDFKTVKIIDSESESIDFREKNRWFQSDRSRHDASFWDVPHLAHARRCWGADQRRSVPSRVPASSPSPRGRHCRATPARQAHSNKLMMHRLNNAAKKRHHDVSLGNLHKEFTAIRLAAVRVQPQAGVFFDS